MKNTLKMDDRGVRWVRHTHPRLKGKRMLARGHFAAVFDGGPDTILKLTRDPLQYAVAADPYHPEGPYFPRLVESYGDVGETNDGHCLYLIEVERLQAINAQAPLAMKRERKSLMQVLDFHASTIRGTLPANRRYSKYGDQEVARLTLETARECEEISEGARQALGDLRDFICNYDGYALDFHAGNMMRRGDQLVLNDVIADTRQL